MDDTLDKINKAWDAMYDKCQSALMDAEQAKDEREQELIDQGLAAVDTDDDRVVELLEKIRECFEAVETQLGEVEEALAEIGEAR